MKGISPMIATILLVGVTVAVAAMVSTWFLGFSSRSVGTVSEKSEYELTCSRGGISFSDVCYSSNYLYGYVSNTGMINLGNVTIQIIYDNATQVNYYLSYSGGSVTYSTTCCGDLVIKPGETYVFNVSCNSNYNRIYVYTNCSNVKDELLSTDISSC